LIIHTCFQKESSDLCIDFSFYYSTLKIFTTLKRACIRSAIDNLFRGDLSYAFTQDLTGWLTVRYVGERLWYRNESQGGGYSKTVTYTLDPYWTTDVKLEMRLFDHWLLSGQANNLLNKEYDTYMSTFYGATRPYPASGYPGAGRSVFFSLTYEY